MVSVFEIGKAFWEGRQLKGGGGRNANTSSIRLKDGRVILVDYGHAVYAERLPNGEVIVYDGWDRYSATTSKHYSQLMLRRTGAGIKHVPVRKSIGDYDMSKERTTFGRQPFVIKSQAQIDNMPPFPFPNFSNQTEERVGWKLTNTYFVDKSGFGREGEPALTPEQFKRVLKVGRGYAIIDEGQFQVYIGEYMKER